MINIIKIGVITHTVKIVHNLYGTNDNGSNRWLAGRIKHDRALIELDDEIDPQSQVVTLWHEVLHGILTQAGQSEQPEHLLDALSYGLVQVIRDNPQLVEQTQGSKSISKNFMDEFRQQIATFRAKLRERLADAQHEIWARWMRWMFEQGTHNADGTWTMPAAKVERWTRQMNTPYRALPDQERNSDREIADELLHILAVTE